ncbi:hypothetical protein HUT28_22500 [Pseudomonas chlororaphis]|nr:hypothetical protein HUT28_22500 [Pseudomonas chlororaphis]
MANLVDTVCPSLNSRGWSDIRSHKKARHKAGLFLRTAAESVVLVLVFILVLSAAGVATIITHAAAQSTTGRATQACANGRARFAAQLVADHRTAGRTQAATDGRFGPAAFTGTDRTAGSAANTRTHRGTCAAANLLSNHVAQRATQTAADRSSAITGSHRTLSSQKPQNQSRQC